MPRQAPVRDEVQTESVMSFSAKTNKHIISGRQRVDGRKSSVVNNLKTKV